MSVETENMRRIRMTERTVQRKLWTGEGSRGVNTKKEITITFNRLLQSRSDKEQSETRT